VAQRIIMATSFLPPVMRTWQYSSTNGGIVKNLKINPSTLVPKPGANQHLVRVIATALNPIDYKPAELPLVGLLAVRKPATPGIDFAGTIVTPATGSSFTPGQLVFGLSGTSPLAGGALSEFALVESKNAVAIPDGVDSIDAATIGVAGLTAYQSIVPRVKEGDKIFINGGSGGTGVFGLQIAKAVGCHVTTSCSTTNVDFCKSLGADVVVDYKKENVIEALIASRHKFDHVVDNVGGNKELYWRCHEYMQPGSVYVMVGGDLSLARVADTMKRKVLPSFLGGMRGNMVGFWPESKPDDLEQIVVWMNEGKVRSVIDTKFSFEQATEAFDKLKTGRTQGKIVINIASDESKIM
jgi:NADPH:quinone reductase-like Zn-dependent oxidoreductase